MNISKFTEKENKVLETSVQEAPPPNRTFWSAPVMHSTLLGATSEEEESHQI